MINLALALVATFVVWLITVLTTGNSLPTFTIYLLYCVSYLVIKEIKYERGE